MIPRFDPLRDADTRYSLARPKDSHLSLVEGGGVLQTTWDAASRPAMRPEKRHPPRKVPSSAR
jgi:hypothetical protein